MSLCLFFIPLLLVPLFGQELSIPQFTEPINDYTNTLNFEEVRALRKLVMQFEDSTSNQIAILIIPTLQGNDIRDYGIRVLSQNKIGQKGKDNGVLILVAKDDKKISIEVGYGLEGVLTDALCDQIIRNEVRPRFKQGEYYQGLYTALVSIISITKGEYKGSSKSGKNSSWGGFLFIVAVIFFAILASSRRRRYGIGSRGYGNWWWGGGGFGGGSSGWSSFGGGGGGGSWSGGGGSFGGGGASGSW